MVGERSRKPWTGDEPVGFDPSTFRQTFPRWIRHWCAKRFAKSCAFQQTRVSSNLTSTAKCVGGRAANATACRAVLPCGANTGGSSPSRRTKFYGRLMATGQTCKAQTFAHRSSNLRPATKQCYASNDSDGLECAPVVQKAGDA